MTCHQLKAMIMILIIDLHRDEHSMHSGNWLDVMSPNVDLSMEPYDKVNVYSGTS
jgi:hypothetical protein